MTQLSTLAEGRISRRHQRNQWASMQKTIYSLPALREILEAANRCYLELLSPIEGPRNCRDKLNKLSQPVHKEGRSYPGLICSTPRTKSCSPSSYEVSSTSAACRIKPYVDFYQTETADRSPGCSTPPRSWPHSKQSATPINTI